MKTSEYESNCMVQNNHNCEYENLLHEQLTDSNQRSETVKRGSALKETCHDMYAST